MLPLLWILSVTALAVFVMAASLGMLKSLPCPAGKNCTAFQCLFKHDRDEDRQALANTTEEEAIQSESPRVQAQHGPRKRLRLSPAPPDAVDDASNDRESKFNQPPVVGEKSRPITLPKATGIDRPISPPPVRRKMPVPADSSVSKAVPPRSAKAASSQKPSSKAFVATATKKPETLNPRNVPKAPAKHNMRLQLVKLLHAQYERLNNELKDQNHENERALLMSPQELIVKTLDDEEHIAVQKPSIYGNVLKLKITSYKKMPIDQWKLERAVAVSKDKGEVSPAKEAHKIIATGLNPAQEVDFLPRLATNLSGLTRFGYVSSIPRDEDIDKARKAVEVSGNIELCDRCGSRFTVFPGRREEDGALTSGGSCTHHPGKTYFVAKPAEDRGSSPKKWRCCDQTVGDTPGCVTANHHVFKTTDVNRLASICNFAETPPNPAAPKDRAVCFDCEMGYTVYGMELIRVTAVSWPAGEELLDVLVCPFGEYIDLNSRYSGVTPKDLAEAERWKPGDNPKPLEISTGDATKCLERKLKIVPSPKDARDLLFSLISPETALIGHGLENDLNAMRIIHPIIVDTILLYPHKRGLPARNSLKWLMESLLDRKIQLTSDDQDNPKGHDSAEDARAAGELVRLKIRDDWRTKQMQGWTMADDGSILPPDGSWTVVGGKKTKRIVA